MYERKINQRKSSGPWLLTEGTLNSIDSLMTKTHDDLIKLNKETEEDSIKKLTIWFKNGAVVEFQSFKEALLSQGYSNQKPIRFQYILESGYKNKINIELDSGWFANCFEYYICCEDDKLEDNIIYEMQKIYFSEKPKGLQALMDKIGTLSFFVYGILVVIFSNVFLSMYNTPIEKTINNRIYQILSKENMQQDDYNELIKYTTIRTFKFYNLVENDGVRNMPIISFKMFIVYLIIGFLLCTILSLSPRASFAIGTGIKKIKFWKTYYKVIYYFIPLMIILPVITNIISNIVFKSIP